MAQCVDCHIPGPTHLAGLVQVHLANEMQASHLAESGHGPKGDCALGRGSLVTSGIEEEGLSVCRLCKSSA